MSAQCDSHKEFHDFVVMVSNKTDVLSSQVSEWRGALRMWGVIITVLNVAILAFTAWKVT